MMSVSSRSLAPWLVGITLLVGCGGRGTGGEGAGAGELAPPDATYETQGVVRQLPRGRRGELLIRHQAVADFTDRHGEVVGMDSMTMGFGVAPEASLEGIEVGDPVQFRFEVRWESDPMLRATVVEKLPPGTEIDFTDSAASGTEPVREESADRAEPSQGPAAGGTEESQS